MPQGFPAPFKLSSQEEVEGNTLAASSLEICLSGVAAPRVRLAQGAGAAS